jgi:hypothetical protein
VRSREFDFLLPQSDHIFPQNVMARIGATQLPNLAVLLCVLFGIPLGAALAAEGSDCVSKKVSFDGTDVLQYANLIDADEIPIRIYGNFPASCKSDGKNRCLASSTAVQPGTAAIANRCGEWAYVEYWGESNVSKGWVRDKNVGEAIPALLPFDDTGDKDLSKRPFKPGRQHFELTRGKSKPVCEAYLQRLNQTVFHAPPYCGRPENDQVPGFSYLKRIYLEGEEFDRLAKQARAFDGRQSIKGWDGYIWQDISSGVAWKYESPIALTNDGTLRKIFVISKQEQFRDFNGCGEERTLQGDPVPDGIRGTILAMFLTDNGADIDVAETKAVFRHPYDGMSYETYSTMSEYEKAQPIYGYFRAIGHSFGIFEFRRQYFFDTFFDGQGWPDFEGRRGKDPSIRKRLAVFSATGQAVSQVCEYKWDDAIRLPPIEP